MNITFFIVLGLAFLSFIIPAAVYGIVSRRAMFNRGGLGSSAVSYTHLTLPTTELV